MAVKGITNSEGGGASYSRSAIALATSEGFFGRYAGTSHSIGVAVLAGEGTAMERDYDHASARHAADLEAPEAVGKRAGERTVARLRSPQGQVASRAGGVRSARIWRGCWAISRARFPARPSRAASASSRTAWARRSSRPAITIIDDPHRLRGLRSKPFDGEGVANARMAIVENGVLKTWLLDCASAKQLGLADHRPCGARHRRAAASLVHQFLYGSPARFRPRN